MYLYNGCTFCTTYHYYSHNGWLFHSEYVIESKKIL
jgi:hypothetical protein